MTPPDSETTGPRLLPAEEMPVGEEIDCGSYQVTEQEIVDFATAWDPQYFHVDRDLAEHSDFGGLIASGLHTASIFQRLAATSVYQRYDVIGGKEVHNMRFLRPVRAGDTLTCSILIRSESSSASSHVRTLAAELLSGDGAQMDSIGSIDDA